MGDKSVPLADLLLNSSLFDRARPDLADLRLYDARGREVPHALRIRRSQDEQRRLAAREFNRVSNPDGAVEVSLDLGESHPEHNEIGVVTSGSEFRRPLQLEGSPDSTTWSTLLDKVYLLRFETPGSATVDRHVFRYPPSRFRFLRVRVSPYPGVPEDDPAFTSVSVSYTVLVPGEYVTLPAVLEPREAVRADGAPGSAWYISLAEGDLAPCESLSFTCGGDEFARPYRLELANPDEPRQVLAQGEWRRRSGSDLRPLVIRCQEVMARRLRLMVTDSRNPPLNLTSVSVTAPARQLLFPTSNAAWPLRLYFGNSAALAPRYDFAATLPLTPQPPPLRLSLAPRQANPDYQPPPKPWTERWPWLVYVVLGAASVVLLAILGMLAFEALARVPGCQNLVPKDSGEPRP
jgi:hypothetical protein